MLFKLAHPSAAATAHFHAFRARSHPSAPRRFLQQRHRLSGFNFSAPRAHPHFVRVPPRQLHRRPRLHLHALHLPYFPSLPRTTPRRDPRRQQLREHHQRPRPPPPPRPRSASPLCPSPCSPTQLRSSSRPTHPHPGSHPRSASLGRPDLGRVAQLARAPRLHRGGRPFESGRAHPHTRR